MVPADISDTIDFASVDVSFISLTKILIPARNLLSSTGEMVCLIKPQFEAGKDKVGKKGVVREKSVHEEVVRKALDFADFIGFDVLNLEFSPIKGPEGNIEYLMHIRKNEEKAVQKAELSEREAEEQLESIIAEHTGVSYTSELNGMINEVVEKAHASLDQ